MSSSSGKEFSGIFVSYRREDSGGHAGRLFDKLVQHFGRERIFMDIDTIEPGEDFVTVIENAVSSCDLLIAVIGQNWLTTGGTGRLNKPNDYVRIEIATALRRDIRVIPVLVQRATVPKAQDLPEDVVKLTRRNAVELSDLRWQSDVEQLIAVMERVLAKRAEERRIKSAELDEANQAAAAVPAPAPAPAPAPVVTKTAALPIYKNRKLMLIAGAVLVALIVGTIILWESLQNQPAFVSNNPPATASPETTSTTGKPAKPPVDIALVYVPAGRFMMGSNDGYKDERPVHQVTFREGFYMSKYEVTQAQWRAVMGENPSRFKNCDNCPVENVSWVDVHLFVEKLNEGNESMMYRLPTEAEWEYACRAGTTGNYAGPVHELAWYDVNSGFKTHPVGMKKPNAFGLYDMHGNVLEWCEDTRSENYEHAPRDGTAWSDGGSVRILRGGKFSDPPQNLYSSLRSAGSDTEREATTGFRVVAVRIK